MGGGHRRRVRGGPLRGGNGAQVGLVVPGDRIDGVEHRQVSNGGKPGLQERVLGGGGGPP